MSLINKYFEHLRAHINAIEADIEPIQKAAKLCADALACGGVIHIYDSGHLVSHELINRAGGLVAFSRLAFWNLLIADFVLGPSLLSILPGENPACLSAVCTSRTLGLFGGVRLAGAGGGTYATGSTRGAGSILDSASSLNASLVVPSVPSTLETRAFSSATSCSRL